MVGPGSARRARGDGGRVLVVSRFDRGPRRVGTDHDRDRDAAGSPGGVHIAVCSDSDGDRGSGPGTSARTGDSGAAGRAWQFPVALGQHQLHVVHSRR